MKYKSPLIVVEDMERSRQFYREVLGLRTVMDFGANVTLTGGLSLQTRESWLGFIGAGPDAVRFGGNDAELYFEEEDFDGFIERLARMEEVDYVHPAAEHPWGQRAVRFYDPDRHIIEVGEDICAVCLRFLDSGMTPEEAAVRMDVPMKFVSGCIRKRSQKGDSKC